ncbi:MAG TPA: class I SAM-dependent methyltransferase [Vicinamibacterales bacterium]
MPVALSPRLAYELWADSYPPAPHNPLMEIEQSIVTRMIEHISAARALDVGSGSGRYLPLLATRASCVIGVDLSMAMLVRSQGRHRVCGDACGLPFHSGSFGLINASLMVGDIADLDWWVRETARVACRGGHLIYSDFHPAWTERGWLRTFRTADGVQHVVEFVPHTIEAHLSALEAGGFRVDTIREPRLKIAGADLPVVAIFHAVKDGAAR